MLITWVNATLTPCCCNTAVILICKTNLMRTGATCQNNGYIRDIFKRPVQVIRFKSEYYFLLIMRFWIYGRSEKLPLYHNAVVIKGWNLSLAVFASLFQMDKINCCSSLFTVLFKILTCLKGKRKCYLLHFWCAFWKWNLLHCTLVIFLIIYTWQSPVWMSSLSQLV